MPYGGTMNTKDRERLQASLDYHNAVARAEDLQNRLRMRQSRECPMAQAFRAIAAVDPVESLVPSQPDAPSFDEAFDQWQDEANGAV